MLYIASLLLAASPTTHLAGRDSLPGIEVRLQEVTVPGNANFCRYFLQISRGKARLPDEVIGEGGFGGKLFGVVQDHKSGDFVLAARIFQNDVDEIYAYSIHASSLRLAWHDTVRDRVRLQTKNGVPILVHRWTKSDADFRGKDETFTWRNYGDDIERRLAYSAKDRYFWNMHNNKNAR